MTGEWCGPTGQITAQRLSHLLDRSRRCTGRQKKPTDTRAPLDDPWFEDSQPVPAPELDPAQPIEIENHRERKERTSIPKVVVVQQPVYPVYRSASAGVLRVMFAIGALLVLIAAIGLVLS